MHRSTFVLTLLLGLAAACSPASEADWVLPDPDVATEWFQGDADAEINGNVLEIRGRMDPDHLQRGGRIWARSGPYFYLFNVHVQKLLTDYPDLAGVRVLTVDGDGDEIARALLTRDRLSSVRWNEALARSSLAQRQGTDNPRLVERLIQFGEDHTDYRYADSN